MAIDILSRKLFLDVPAREQGIDWMDEKPGEYRVFLGGYAGGVQYVAFSDIKDARWWVLREIRRISKEFTAAHCDFTNGRRKYVVYEIFSSGEERFIGCNDFCWQIEEVA